MKDNFDLKKFLKESKAIENLNPSLKSINEKEDKSLKENSLKSKIREMIIDELSEDNVSVGGNVRGTINPAAPIDKASNDDYDFLSESDDLHEEDKDERDMEGLVKAMMANTKARRKSKKEEDAKEQADYERHKKSMGLEEVDTKKLDAEIQKDPKLLDKVKTATEKAMKGDSTDLARLMAMPLEEAEKDEDGEEMEDESREERADVDKFEFEKGKEAGEEEKEGGIEAIAADLDGTEKDLMGNLMNALKIAKGMDNEKLEVQIGNTLKFFVSTYIDKEENER